jgi:hypothetical protein
MPEQNESGQEQGQPVTPPSGDAAPSQTPNGNSEGNPTPPAQGEKLLAGKYKSVEDLEKGYKESTKFSREQATKLKDLETKMPKAPDKYSFDFSQVKGLEEVKIDENDPEMKSMLPVFKELNLTQEQATRLLTAHMQTQAALAPTEAQLKEQLGANADVIIGRLQTFTNKLPVEDQKIVSALSDTAEGVDFLYRHLVGEELPTPPSQGGGNGEPAKSAADLKSEAFKYKADNSRSIGFDKNQQTKYQQMLNAAIAAEEREKNIKK